MLIDTHCHIQFKAFYDDVEDVILRCKEKNMILNLVGTQAETSKRAVEWAEKYDWMYASVGLHPIQEYNMLVLFTDCYYLLRLQSTLHLKLINCLSINLTVRYPHEKISISICR